MDHAIHNSESLQSNILDYFGKETYHNLFSPLVEFEIVQGKIY